MTAIKKIPAAEAKKMIAEIDTDPDCKLGVIKLGKFHYDITNATDQELEDFIYEHNRRVVNRPEFGATKV